jgi:flagellar basal body-associated protein FliL
MTQSSTSPNGAMGSEKNSGSKKWIIIAVLLLIVIVAILIWFLPMKNKYLSMISEKENQRVELQNELNQLLIKHDSIKAEYGALSDTLAVKDSIIMANAKEIQELLNYKWEYGKVNKKLELLRKISQGYVHQLDSLYTVNRELKEENEKIRQQYDQEQDKTRTLSKDKEKLVEKLTQATVLKAYSISSVGVRLTGSGKEKETDKAAKIERVKVCFTLGENKLVEPGRKTVYVRIVRPDNVVVTQKLDGDYTFQYQGQTMEYTSKQEVDYQNKDTSTCIYWTKKSKEEDAMVGTYNVFIYADGFEIGTSSFVLK